MYTEDDEKVEVKKDNSNIKYSDFYTSFSDIGKEEKKSKKVKKKTSPKPKETPVKTEDDYQDFYGTNDDEVVSDNSNNNGKKNITRLIIVGALLIILIVLVIVLIILGNRVKGDILLDKEDIVLDIGGKEYISYKVIDTESMVTSKFASSNENVAIINDNGEITAVGEGEAIITVYYTIGNVTREKTCTIRVSGTGSIDRNIKLDLKLENGKDNTWTNKDVTINPEASSIFGIASIKYAINCDDNCEYKDISNSKITISSSGVTKVKVVAKDKQNQEAVKEVTIKIDKEAPGVTLNSDTNIKSNKDVEVCATCTDSVSGCKKSKVCKTYSSSKSNQTITVEDAAGNKSSSKSFNVTITKTTAPCNLSVSSDGVITASLKEEASYYGFNSDYSGSNELSKKIDINVSSAGKSLAKVFYYYVKSKNGNMGRCFLTVVKTCACANNTTGQNCQVSCTFASA